MELRRFEGKVAIVTGGGMGIGRATCQRLAKEGARIAICDLSEEAARGTGEMVAREGAEWEFFQCDVRQKQEVERTVAGVAERFGQVDVLVNNVGGGRPVPTMDITESDWDEMFAFNVKGAFFCSQAVLKLMAGRRYGKIVNVSSIAGRSVSVLQGPHYTASKTAVIGLTRHLAREFAPFGVNVNAVAPGTTATERILRQMSEERKKDLISKTPLGRMAVPEDMAGVIAFLASDDAAFVTGVVIDVNGGYFMAG